MDLTGLFEPSAEWIFAKSGAGIVLGAIFVTGGRAVTAGCLGAGT